MSVQLWVPWVVAPHLKVKGLGKDGKLAQEEWHLNEAKVNAPGFCLVGGPQRRQPMESLSMREMRSSCLT